MKWKSRYEIDKIKITEDIERQYNYIELLIRVNDEVMLCANSVNGIKHRLSLPT